MSTPVQALVALVLLHTRGMSTELFADSHCTVPPSGTSLLPKSVMTGSGTAGGAVVDADVVDGLVVVGGVVRVLDELEELRLVAGRDAADERAGEDAAAVAGVDPVPPDAAGSDRPLRAIR